MTLRRAVTLGLSGEVAGLASAPEQVKDQERVPLSSFVLTVGRLADLDWAPEQKERRLVDSILILAQRGHGAEVCDHVAQNTSKNVVFSFL